MFDDLMLEFLNGFSESWAFMTTLFERLSSKASNLIPFLTPFKIQEFQKRYRALVQQTAKTFKTTERKMLLELGMRSSIINQYDRITGNSIIEVTDKVLRERKRLSFDEMQRVIHDFIHYQKMRPDPDTKNKIKTLNSVEQRRSQKVMHKIMGLVRENRESL